VIVTGAWAPIPLNEADRTVHLITLDQCDVAFHDAMDALQSEPSIDLRQRAPGIQGDLSIRGSTFGQTLVLVDGLRMNDAQTAHNNLDLPFPFSAVQQIEVLDGTGSTLYGADALGGVVNFQTAVPEESDVKLAAGVGNFGTNMQSGVLALHKDFLTEQITFNRELSTGFVPNRDYRSLALGAETSFHSSLGLTRVLLGLSDRPFGAQGFYGNYPSWERTKGWFAGLTQPLGSKTDVSFGYRRHTDLYDLFRYQPWIYQNDHITESWQAALRRHDNIKPNVQVYYGAEGYRDTIDSNNLGHHVRDRGAVYGALDIRALRRFSFNAGVREERFTGGHSAFTPSVSGGYWVNTHLKFHAAASTAYRLPTFTDLYYSDPANIGNPHLLPERATSYEGGAQVTFGRLTGDATVFRRYDNDVIDYLRANPPAIWQAENLQNLQFTGVTATARIRLARAQRVEVGYTALHGTEHALPPGDQSKYVFEYPVQSASVSWWGEAPQRVILHLRIGVLDRYARDPYPLAELSASRAFGYCKPFVQLRNVMNAGYEEIPGVRMPGRSYLVGIEFTSRTRAHVAN